MHSPIVAHEVNQKTGEASRFDPRLFLRDEELDHGIGLLLAAERALRRESDAGLNGSAARILLAIRFQPALTVSQMRESLDMTVPTLARLLGELDKRGLIAKTPSGMDARKRRLSLSPAGEDVIEPAVSAMRASLREAYREAGANAVVGAKSVLEALRP